MSGTYKARAKRWARGWELHIEDEGVTQVRTLDRAVDQVRDYLSSLHDDDDDFTFADAEVDIEVDLDGYETRVREARAKGVRAAELQLEAARDLREVTRHLRSEGLSVTDIAATLGVSRGRVSQLLTEAESQKS